MCKLVLSYGWQTPSFPPISGCYPGTYTSSLDLRCIQLSNLQSTRHQCPPGPISEQLDQSEACPSRTIKTSISDCIMLPKSPAQTQQASLHIKRSLAGGSAFGAAIVLSMILATAFAALILVLMASTLYKRWQEQRGRALKRQQSRNEHIGAVTRLFEKPELSGEAPVQILEMDVLSGRTGLPHELHEHSLPQELPEMKEGLPHKLPEGGISPQELPGTSHGLPIEVAVHRRILKQAREK
ncbi:hypothetical protein HD806DRAFT_547193 [Xylariaceae sp. AK1471]|nr:hypothetical protein HD806DRAFT_547193 [Xylariaceae sp. AK1471]